MTPEEAKKLVAGDVVLVRAVVVEVHPRGGWATTTVRVQADDAQCHFSADDIHSVLPRPLAVGDRVLACGDLGQIVHITDAEACVDLGTNAGLAVFLIGELVRAP